MKFDEWCYGYEPILDGRLCSSCLCQGTRRNPVYRQIARHELTGEVRDLPAGEIFMPPYCSRCNAMILAAESWDVLKQGVN